MQSLMRCLCLRLLCESRAKDCFALRIGQSLAGKVQEVNNIGGRSFSQLMCNLPLKFDLQLYSVHCLESHFKILDFN